jgi:hypothetical protein
MKRVVSVSLGASQRNACVETSLLGVPLRLERIGVDGDLNAARRCFLELDGQVDAFGVGGADLAITVAGRTYPLHSVARLVSGLSTPAVDGGGLRRVVERRLPLRLDDLLPEPVANRRVFICTAVARYDLAEGFADAGFAGLYGDLGMGFGLPIPLHSLKTLACLARLILPVMVRLPFRWLYPTGDDQDAIHPRFANWYAWAGVIADDFHYLKKHLPERLDGKVVVTNTTTPKDVALLRSRGVRYLCTTTPRLEGRSFGTNVIEAAFTAIAGMARPLTYAEIAMLVDESGLQPHVMALADSA